LGCGRAQAKLRERAPHEELRQRAIADAAAAVGKQVNQDLLQPRVVGRVRVVLLRGCGAP